jgi:hypothetical protein
VRVVRAAAVVPVVWVAAVVPVVRAVRVAAALRALRAMRAGWGAARAGPIRTPSAAAACAG